MKKIDITTDQWIEIHKTLREVIPMWFIPHLKLIFEIHRNEEMIRKMNEVKESVERGEQ